MKIAVLVDSTAVMGEYKHEHLYTVPLKIIFEQDIYEDGIDLTQETFFELLRTRTQLPTTSQPAIGEVVTIFNDLLERYDHVIYFTLSSKISGTYESGMMARSLIDESKVTVFDSNATSIVEKLMVLESLNLLDKGSTLNEILSRMENFRQSFKIYMVVDDLKHLWRTGRASVTTASLGSMLKIKPILMFDDGKIEVYKKVRSVKKAHGTLVDLVKEANLKDEDLIYIAHAEGLEYAEAIRDEIQKVYPNIKVGIDALSPVISVHTGPKTVGIGWIRT